MPAAWPENLGPDVPADAPKPDLTLPWAAEPAPNTHADYNGYTDKAGATPRQFPIPASDFSHDHDPGDDENPPNGWGRLKSHFEYLIHEIMREITAMDDAVRLGNPGTYNPARARYLQLLRELNKAPLGAPPPAAYPTEWFYVMPTIRAGRIIGATLILQWNPHSSSSIVHK
jgi:hypothetical protein